LDAVDALMPAATQIFHAVELFPPEKNFRIKRPNYWLGSVGDMPIKFGAGVCIEVIELLTPRILNSLVKDLASKSNTGAVFYFGSGQPAYVNNENPEYLDPYGRGHVVSYSLLGISKVFNKYGFNIIPLPGRDWAFLAEYGPEFLLSAEELLTRIWTALPANVSRLKDPIFGPLMYSVGIESARCYLEHAIRNDRTKYYLNNTMGNAADGNIKSPSHGNRNGVVYTLYKWKEQLAS
jgi:hypothetical protein